MSKTHYETTIYDMFEFTLGRQWIENYIIKIVKKLDIHPMEASSIFNSRMSKTADQLLIDEGSILSSHEINMIKTKSHLKSSVLAILYTSIKWTIKNELSTDTGVHAFLSHPPVKKTYDMATSQIGVKAFMAFNLYWTLAMYELSRRKSYILSPGLGESLLETELRGLRTDDIRLPYNSIYIEIPRNLEFKIEAGVIQGVYITECANEIIKDDVNKKADVLPGRLWIIQTVAGATSAAGHGMYGAVLSMLDGQKFEDVLRGKLVASDLTGELKSTLESVKSALGVKDDDLNNLILDGIKQNKIEFSEGQIQLIKWLTNVVIYSTWADADIEHIMLNKTAEKLWKRIKKKPSGPKRKKLTSQAAMLDPNKRIYLGRSISTINRTTTEYITDGKSSKGQKLNIRTLVQGHWRHYWVGKGREYRERKWIRPFWRGNKDAPIRLTTHRLVGHDNA